MFEPTLVGILPSQFFSIFRDLLAPMLAFMFLFLLGLPLKEIPFVKGLTNYDPPEYVLPVFALGSLFLSSFILGTILFLNTWSEQIDTILFKSSFQITRTLDLSNSNISAVRVRLNHYDGLSNFNIIVNGYRIFGSESNCALQYQCLDVIHEERIERDVENVNKEIKKIPKQYGGPGFGSAHYIRERFSLPHIELISNFLVEGPNCIDVYSWNSGRWRR